MFDAICKDVDAEPRRPPHNPPHPPHGKPAEQERTAGRPTDQLPANMQSGRRRRDRWKQREGRRRQRGESTYHTRAERRELSAALHERETEGKTASQTPAVEEGRDEEHGETVGGGEMEGGREGGRDGAWWRGSNQKRNK